MRSDQDLFNTVARHLLKQKVKAVVPEDEEGHDLWTENSPIHSGACVYRFDGLKCAIGCLIPDNKYQPKFEGHSLSVYRGGDETEMEFLEAIKSAADISERQLPLARALQTVHDNSEPKQWAEKLVQLAFFFDLDSMVPRGYLGEIT